MIMHKIILIRKMSSPSDAEDSVQISWRKISSETQFQNKGHLFNACPYQTVLNLDLFLVLAKEKHYLWYVKLFTYNGWDTDGQVDRQTTKGYVINNYFRRGCQKVILLLKWNEFKPFFLLFLNLKYQTNLFMDPQYYHRFLHHEKK